MIGIQGNTTVTNVTGPDLPTYLEEPLAATIFQITLWSTIAFLGLIGNVLVCTVIMRRLKKTSMNYYLLSLAIADLGVLVIIYPVAVCRYLKPFVWLLGEQFCLYLMPTEEIFFGASIWSITAIAIERYRNIVGVNRYKFWNRSRLRTALGIFAVWLASFLVSCVPLYPVMTYVQSPSGPMCGHTWGKTYFVTYFIALIVVWYVLPLAVITFTYVKIRQRVRHSAVFRNSMATDDNHDLTKMPQSVEARHTKARRMWRQSNKTKRLLTPLVILFAVTMFPLNALRVVALINNDIWKNKYYNLGMGLITLFIITNSSANPLVYYLTSKEFKDAYKGILKSVRGMRSRRNFSDFLRRSSSRYSFGLSSSPSTKSIDVGVYGKMFSNGINNNISRQSVVSTLTQGDVQFESVL